MIAHIEGKLTRKDPAFAIVDVQGVGYEIRISLQTHTALPAVGERTRLLTHLHVREDAHLLYGFAADAERTLFLQLTAVSGIGPNSALLMLSSLSVSEIQTAILREEVRTLQGVKGVGVKMAQRIILELKDRLRKHADTEMQAAMLPGGHNSNREEALSALVMLGLPKATAEKALDTVIRRAEAPPSVEDLIKQVLKSA